MTMRALLPTWSEWKPAFRAPGTDLMSGLVVALVALPLALGFGISSGLGAAAGLATAVVAVRWPRSSAAHDSRCRVRPAR